MLSSLKKMRGDKKGWYKVSDLRPGVEIAVPMPEVDGSVESPGILWDEIVSIKPVCREQVYDIEVEGTHNFVGNGIFAHNTYVLRANTMLAVDGEINALSVVVPSPLASTTLMAEIPQEVLTADGKGVDLYKLSTYNLASINMLGARVDDQGVRITSLESRVDKLESGAVSSDSGNIGIGSSTLASALNSLGAYISKGFAQFGSLIADRFIAATDSAGTSSAGTVSILSGNTIAQVTNAYVKSSTKIFITFNSPVTGSWYVSDKQDGSFRVVLSQAETSDVSFDYFLVQTEGQIATSSQAIVDTTQVGHPMSDLGGQTSPVTTSPATPVADNPAATTTIATTSPSVATSTPPSDISTSTSTPQSTDTTAPVVVLNGAAAIQINIGDTFADPGATATDDVDGDLTAKIVVTGTVDTATAGLYTLTYTAIDVAGNHGSVSRVVTVVAPPPAAPTPPTTPTDTTATVSPTPQ